MRTLEEKVDLMFETLVVNGMLIEVAERPMTRNRIYPIEERLDALGKGKDQTDEQVEGRVVRRMMEDISESHRDAPAKDRRVSNFKPLDPCLAVLYVKLKPGESLTVKAPTIAGDGVLVFRDRRLKGE